MRPFRMPPQIVRLVLLTIGIVSAYFTARYFLTPASFGERGWYRANALADIATPKPVYAGKQACDECHSDQLKDLAKLEHKVLSCEVCHGAGQAHAGNPDANPMVKLGYSRCVRCHEASPSKPAWMKQIDSKKHFTGEKCIDCHKPHQPSEVP